MVSFKFTLTKDQSGLLRKGLEKVVYDPMGGNKYVKDLRGLVYKLFPEALLDTLE